MNAKLQFSAANDVIKQFELSFAIFLKEHLPLCNQLQEAIAKSNTDLLDELFEECVSELKDKLSSSAANLCFDDDDEQEENMSYVEKWVSKCHLPQVALILCVKGIENGAGDIKSLLEKTAKRTNRPT